MTMRDCDSLNNTVAASLCDALADSFFRVLHVAHRATATVDLCSKKSFGIETGFGECNGKSAFGAIVRALHETFTNQIANGILHLDFMCEIDVWRRTDF